MFARLAWALGDRLTRFASSRGWSVLDDRWYSNVPIQTLAGIDITPENAMQCIAVYACNRVLASSIASCPLDFYERTSSGRRKVEDDWRHSRVHNRPNSLQSPGEFKEYIVLSLGLRGNAYILKEPTDRWALDTALVPIHPDRVKVKLNESGQKIFQIRTEQGGWIEKNTETVIHIKNLSTDGLTGLSPVRQAMESIGLSVAAEQTGASFFGNAMRPGGYIKTPYQMNNKQKRDLAKQWNAAYSGTKNTGRTPILEYGEEYVPFKISPEEAQFLETRKFQIDEICRLYGVPPHKIAQLDRSTNNNIEHQGMEFHTDTLLAIFTKIEEALSFGLISDEDRDRLYFEFNADVFLRGDIGSRYSAYATGRQWGWLATNDILKRENLSPVEDGDDDHLIPQNMVLRRDLLSGKVLPGAVQNRRKEDMPDSQRGMPVIGGNGNGKGRGMENDDDQ